MVVAPINILIIVRQSIQIATFVINADILRAFAELRHEAQPSSRIDLNEGAHCLKPAGAVGTPEVVNIVQDLGQHLVMLLLKRLRTQ